MEGFYVMRGIEQHHSADAPKNKSQRFRWPGKENRFGRKLLN
jgi:hypothetical protein